jgi:hypothetical protein
VLSDSTPERPLLDIFAGTGASSNC